MHAQPARHPRHLAPDAAQADDPQRLAQHLHALDLPPLPGAHLAVHPRHAARRRQGQGDRVLGHRGVAVALDGVHGDAAAPGRREVDERGRPGAEEHDPPQPGAPAEDAGIEVGMVIDAGVIAGQQRRNVLRLPRRHVDRHGRVARALHACPERGHVVRAVEEDRGPPRLLKVPGEPGSVPGTHLATLSWQDGYRQLGTVMECRADGRCTLSRSS